MKRTWKYKIRPVAIEASDCIITLACGKIAVVDAADAALVSEYNWSWDGACVVSGAGKLHHSIMKPRDGLLPDHQDGDTLNNRRSNLRYATKAQNAQNRARGSTNTSGFKGVSFRADRGTWLATIRSAGKLTKIGTFATPETAARAHDAAARDLFGQFACVNFPTAGERQA